MVKFYVCGYCGQPTNKDGNALSLAEIEDSKFDLESAELVHGLCCAGGYENDESGG